VQPTDERITKDYDEFTDEEYRQIIKTEYIRLFNMKKFSKKTANVLSVLLIGVIGLAMFSLLPIIMPELGLPEILPTHELKMLLTGEDFTPEQLVGYVEDPLENERKWQELAAGLEQMQKDKP